MGEIINWFRGLLGLENSLPGILGEAHNLIYQGIAEADLSAARAWSSKLTLAAKNEADTSLVWPKFAHWLLSNLGRRPMSVPLDEGYLNQQQIIQDSVEIFERWAQGHVPTTSELAAASLRTTFALKGLTTSDMACAVAGYALDSNPVAITHAVEQVKISRMEFCASEPSSYMSLDFIVDYGNETRRKHFLKMADKLLEIVANLDRKPSLE